jgi:hypothetical protein
MRLFEQGIERFDRLGCLLTFFLGMMFHVIDGMAGHAKKTSHISQSRCRRFYRFIYNRLCYGLCLIISRSIIDYDCRCPLFFWH